MITDENKIFSGYNMSVSKVTDEELLAQFTEYRNISAAMIMRSPLYFTSVDDCDQTNIMDLLMLNIPNTTDTPAESKAEYVGTCSDSTIDVTSSAIPFSSKCYHPNNYANNMNCSFVINPAPLSYTQITVLSFDFEAYYDYLVFEGPTDFIIFANSSTNQVIITGFPNVTINSRMITNANATLNGFEMSVSKVTDVELLAQFTEYRNMSAAFVMKSPMYLTGYDDCDQTNKMDILLMNILNTTDAPAESKIDFIGTCSPSPIQVASLPISFGTPCYPKHYTNNMDCSFVLNPANSSYIQITIESFDLESWHDYVQFDGPTNFIVFGNSSTNQLIVTGYSNVTINTRMITDANITFSGFQMSTSKVTDAELLTQFTGYRNMSAALIMRSPMYVTSFDDYNLKNKMDVMMMNIPNTTNTPAAAWPEYVGLVAQKAMNVTEITATGFKVTWTSIEAAISYTARVADNTGNSYITNQTTETMMTVNHLPSGTPFNISVEVTNKLGSTASILYGAATDVIKPTGLSITDIAQTTVIVHWTPVYGAAFYEVYINETERRNAPKDANNLTVDRLTPGKFYTLNLTAVFPSGNNATALTTVSFTTVPGNVSGVTFPNISTTTVGITWNDVSGANTYQVSLDTGKTLNVSDTSAQFSDLKPGAQYSGSITPFNTLKGFPTDFTFTTSLLDSMHSLRLVATNSSSISVSWSNVSGAVNYHIQLINSSGTVLQNETTTGAMPKVFSGLLPGHHFNVTVNVEDSTGRFHPMNILSANTSRLMVTGLKKDIATQTMITYSWDSILGVISYKAMRNDTLVNSAASPPYKDSGLQPGTLYKFGISAVFETGDADPMEIYEWTVPGNVTNVTISKSSTTTVQLSWELVDGAISFEILIEKVLRKNVTGQSTMLTDLTPGTNYNGSITPTGARRGFSEIFTFSTDLLNGSHTLSMKKKTPFSVTVEWSGVPAAQEYHLQVTNSSGLVAYDKKLNSSVTTEQIMGLLPGRNFRITVKVLSRNNKYHSLNIVNVTTSRLNVTGLLANNVTQTMITYSWDSIPGVISYKAMRNNTLVNSAASSPYKASGLQAGTLYKFGISAVFETGEGDPTEIYEWTVPGNVTNVTISKRSTTSVQLSLELVDGVILYEILIEKVLRKNFTGSSTMLTKLTPGTNYNGFVTPIGAWRGFPETFTFSTDLLNGSHTLRVKNTTPFSVTVEWSDVPAASGYHLQVTNSSGLVAYDKILNSSVTTERIMELLPGRNFRIIVKVLSNNNKYHSLNIVNATTNITGPSVPQIVNITQSKAIVLWTPVIGAIKYKINITGNGSITAPRDATSLTITGLEPGATFGLDLFAIFPAGDYAPAPMTVQFSTVPDNVTMVKTTKNSTSSVQLSWNLANGANSYEISLDNVLLKNSTGKSTMLTNLTPGTNYNGSITPIGAWRGFPEFFTFLTDLLNGSHTLRVKETTPSSITVEWSEVPGAREYHLQITNSSGLVAYDKNLKFGVTMEEITGLFSGKRFEIIVKALSNNNKYHSLNAVNTTTEKTTVAKKKNSATTSTILFSWNNIPGAQAYKVYSNGMQVRNGTSTQYTLQNLNAGTFHYIEVITTFEIGIGEAKKLDGWTIPGEVTGLQVPENKITETTFEAKWNQRPNVTYSLSLQVKNAETFADANAQSGKKYTVSPGTKYTLTVKAKNLAGEGMEATAMFTTKLGSPNVKHNSVSKKRFQLTWQTVTGAEKYGYKCGDSMAETKTTAKDRWIDNLQPGTTYKCTVTAYTEFTSSAEKTISVTTSQASCIAKPCQNQGICSEREPDFHCACSSSYVGRNCEKVRDWCGAEGYKENICDRNSQCTNNPELGRGVCTCNDGFTGDATIKCLGFCRNREIMYQNDTLTFPFTFAGMTVYSNETCRKRSKASIVCSADATGAAKFDINKLVYVPCNLTLAIVINNTALVNEATPEELEKQTEELQVLTSGVKVKEEEVGQVAEYIEDLSNTAKQEAKKLTTEILENVANAVDNLIATNSINLTEPSAIIDTPTVTLAPTASPIDVRAKEKEIKKKILTSLNSLAQQVEIPENKTEHVITTPTMVLKVIDADEEDDEPVSFSPVIVKAVSTSNGTKQETVQPVQITIPSTAITKGAESSNKTLRISFILHRDISLFPAPPPSPSLIVSATLGADIHIVNLKDKVTMKYDEKEKPGEETKVANDRFLVKVNRFKCVYWNETTGEWLTNGCCLNGLNASDLTKCECDHLTNFALIVAKDDLKANIPLEITSSVGLGLSMAGLVLTIIIHALKEDVRSRRPTQILFNICFNLIVANGLFVAGINRTAVKNHCAIIASCMHFFYLTSWTWMTVYAYDMYRSLVLVFTGGKSHYMTKCALFAYGMPLVITGFDAAFSFVYIDPRKRPEGVCEIPTGYQHLDGLIPKKSAYLADNICWIHDYSLYFGFLCPVGIMLTFNTFVYGMVLKTLLQRGKGVQSSAKKTSIKDNILISITLTSSTGIAWVSGYFLLISDNEQYLTVMSWVFASLNTTQGIVIFLSTCVRNENMRKVWIEPIAQFFSRTRGRFISKSSKMSLFDVSTTKSEMGTSSIFSTSESTKNTTVKSISVKELTSESAF